YSTTCGGSPTGRLNAGAEGPQPARVVCRWIAARASSRGSHSGPRRSGARSQLAARRVSGCYSSDKGRPGIDPEAAVRLMLAGFLLGIVYDRRLMREAQVNLADPLVHRLRAA